MTDEALVMSNNLLVDIITTTLACQLVELHVDYTGASNKQKTESAVINAIAVLIFFQENTSLSTDDAVPSSCYHLDVDA